MIVISELLIYRITSRTLHKREVVLRGWEEEYYQKLEYLV